MSDSILPSLLVVGAAKGSLGHAVETAAKEWDFAAVHTAGISGEDIKLDVLHSAQMVEVLARVRPDIIICTVGVNEPCGIYEQYLSIKMYDSFRVNTLGPLELLRAFITSPLRPEREGCKKKFVAISSNSARIPRRDSLPYCASKAALSMGLRVAAREMAGDPVQVWGYEPGLLAGTPMTRQSLKDFGGNDPGTKLHRMRGVPDDGLDPYFLAERIINDVASYSPAYNGVLFPYDAGEL